MTNATDLTSADVVDPVTAGMAARLAMLRQDYQTGANRLRDIAREQSELQETLLRISGAIQVLEELLASDAPPEPDANGQFRVP